MIDNNATVRPMFVKISGSLNDEFINISQIVRVEFPSTDSSNLLPTTIYLADGSERKVNNAKDIQYLKIRLNGLLQ
jgi:hypothetical protein